MYFIPIVYLISLYTISQKGFLDRKTVFIVLIILFINNFYIYPEKFIDTPYLPYEVNYLDDNPYLDLKNLCNDSLIIVDDRPGRSTFFAIRPDYQINYNYLRPQYFDYFTKVPVIADDESLMRILDQNKNQRICIMGFRPFSWISGKTLDYIRNNFILYRSYKYTDKWPIELYKNF